MVDELNPNTNENPTADETSELKAQLELEQQAKAAFEADIALKDAKIAELQAEGEALRAERGNLNTEVSRLTQDLEAMKVELTTGSTSIAEVKANLEQAVTKYRDLVVGSNPHLADFIQGASIDELNTSVENAKALVEKVKLAIELETKQATVPAGAPVRATIPPEGMSSREKIVYGIGQKR